MEKTKPVDKQSLPSNGKRSLPSDGKKVEKNGKPVKKGFQFKLRINLWTVALTILVIFFVIPGIIAAFQSVGSSTKESVSQLMTDIKAGKVEKVSVESSSLNITY